MVRICESKSNPFHFHLNIRKSYYWDRHFQIFVLSSEIRDSTLVSNDLSPIVDCLVYPMTLGRLEDERANTRRRPTTRKLHANMQSDCINKYIKINTPLDNTCTSPYECIPGSKKLIMLLC